MAVDLALTLTSDGKGAFWNSRSTGISLDITHIQFGALNRLTTGEESSLGLPKQYTQIQNGSKIGVDQVRIMATMPGLENYNVAEIGLWSGVPNQAGSILVAYISVATGFIAQMVSGIDLVFTYDMVVSTIDIDYVNIVKDTDQSSTFSLLAIHESDRNAHPYYLTTDTAQTISGAKTFSNKAIFSGGLSGELTGNAATATALKTARNIGGVSFNGTANINLPGVNETGNQNTTGNAATATKLATARTINGVSFDGGSNISIGDPIGLFLGGVQWFNGARAKVPDGYLTADGQLLSRTTYPDLWAAINATYAPVTDAVWLASSTKRACFSTGNGTTTFRMPDLNGFQTGSSKGLFLRGDGNGVIANETVSSGSVLSDAIRNISGSYLYGLDSDGTINNSGVATGVFNLNATSERDTINNISVTAYAQANGWYRLNFNASDVVPTANENRPVSAVGVWIIRAIGKTTPQPANGSPATLLANTFNGSQEISGNLSVSGKIALGSSDIQVVNGANYTITYDYSTRLAHIQMRVFTNQSIYLGLPYSGSTAELYFRDVTLPITLRKRLFTDVFFTAAAGSVGQMEEAYEWMWWTPPAGYAGSTDSKVRISARRLSGSMDEPCHCDLYVTGYF